MSMRRSLNSRGVSLFALSFPASTVNIFRALRLPLRAVRRSPSPTTGERTKVARAAKRERRRGREVLWRRESSGWERVVRGTTVEGVQEVSEVSEVRVVRSVRSDPSSRGSSEGLSFGRRRDRDEMLASLSRR